MGAGSGRLGAFAGFVGVSALLLAATLAVAFGTRETVGTPRAEPPAPSPPRASLAPPGPPGTASVSSPVTVAGTQASCQSPDGVDAAGTVSSYEPARAVDGNPATAWRCDGDGSGQRLTLDLGRPVRVTALTIVPGFAKTDPADGTDRYAQSRRIARIRVLVDGAVAEQDLDTTPTSRQPQVVALPGTPTTAVTLEVLASAAGSGVGNDGAVDKIAISEVVVLGTG